MNEYQDIITPAQCRMARAALRLGVRELAERAGTSAPTVCRFENGVPVFYSIVNDIRTALIDAGVIFVRRYKHAGPGVRMKHG